MCCMPNSSLYTVDHASPRDWRVVPTRGDGLTDDAQPLPFLFLPNLARKGFALSYRPQPFHRSPGQHTFYTPWYRYCIAFVFISQSHGSEFSLITTGNSDENFLSSLVVATPPFDLQAAFAHYPYTKAVFAHISFPHAHLKRSLRHPLLQYSTFLDRFLRSTISISPALKRNFNLAPAPTGP